MEPERYATISFDLSKLPPPTPEEQEVIDAMKGQTELCGRLRPDDRTITEWHLSGESPELLN